MIQELILFQLSGQAKTDSSDEAVTIISGLFFEINSEAFPSVTIMFVSLRISRSLKEVLMKAIKNLFFR